MDKYVTIRFTKEDIVKHIDGLFERTRMYVASHEALHLDFMTWLMFYQNARNIRISMDDCRRHYMAKHGRCGNLPDWGHAQEIGLTLEQYRDTLKEYWELVK